VVAVTTPAIPTTTATATATTTTTATATATANTNVSTNASAGQRASARAKAHAPSPAPASSLDAQLSSLARARESLAGGRPDAALSSLDDYDARFPGGAFAQEAGVLRVQALVAQGDRAGAQRVAARFLAAYPQSPHAARVRTLVGTTP
jgi:outer membrane protein assembly factor BamD (BamD/ComL family)